MIEPIEQRIALGPLMLAAQTWGDPASPPLLAVHGWLDNAASFARLAPLLATRLRVIALDLPGHGHADHLPDGTHYHFSDYVRIVLATADALKLGRFSLLGHSLGAGIASLAAAAAPARIEHLYLIEGLGPLGDDGTQTLERFRKALLAPAANGKSLRRFRDIDQAIGARAAASGLRAELARPIVERGLRELDGGWQWRSDPRLARPTAIRLAETQVRALLAGITIPASLLLARPTTPYLPDAMMRQRAACVPHIDVESMDGGHHLHLEHPQAVAAWMARRIGATPPSPPDQ